MATLRARDSILAAYYLVFLTANWYALSGFDARDCATGFLMLGLVSVFVALTVQRDRADALKFGRQGFRTFLLLMAALIAVDFLTIAWPGRAPWLPKGRY